MTISGASGTQTGQESAGNFLFHRCFYIGPIQSKTLRRFIVVDTEKRQDVMHYRELIRKTIAEKQKHHYRRMNTAEWSKVDGFYQKLIENYRGKMELARKYVM